VRAADVDVRAPFSGLCWSESQCAAYGQGDTGIGLPVTVVGPARAPEGTGGGRDRSRVKPSVFQSRPTPVKFGSANPRIDPRVFRFSQDSCSYNFRKPEFVGGARNIDELAEGLRTGRIRPEQIDPIRIAERDGKLYSLDNTRLEAFRRAGVPIPVRSATQAEIDETMSHWSTGNFGVSIFVRGEP
jgi:hypothetical protein